MNFGFIKLVGRFALALAICPAARAQITSASISGMVRDTAGIPQVGAMVELVSANTLVVATTFTDSHGQFLLHHIDLGTYNVKAVGSAFLPALRENLKVRADTVVNLTLTSLFEAAQWLPVQKRSSDDADDDWIWTLRSASNRPLLRMLEDGPLVIVTNSDSDSRPVMKARVTLSSADHTFGEGGLRNAFELTESKSDSRQLILRASFVGGGSSAFESMVGYRQDLGPGRTLRTVVSIEDSPQIVGTSSQMGAQSMVIRSSQTIALSPDLHAEVGNELQAIRLGQTQVSNHPFGGVVWSDGQNSVAYRLATSPELQRAEQVDAGRSTVPVISSQDGVVRVEHGLHQQAGVEHADGNVRVQLALYRDQMKAPVITGGGEVSAADMSGGEVLYDTASRMMRVQGPDYSARGFVGDMQARLFGDTWMSFAYANGTALELGDLGQSTTLGETVSEIRATRSEMYAAALKGRVKCTGTKWRASYRWQPADTLTEVAAFDSNQPDAYFSLYMRQPIHYGKIFPNGMEALIDVRNLLAEGYRPFVTSDGSTLYFAKTERSIQGGLSFTF